MSSFTLTHQCDLRRDRSAEKIAPPERAARSRAMIAEGRRLAPGRTHGARGGGDLAAHPRGRLSAVRKPVADSRERW